MRPTGGGCHPPVTSEDGYGLGLTPKCLHMNDSHGPTIHRLHQSLPGEPTGPPAAIGQARLPALAGLAGADG